MGREVWARAYGPLSNEYYAAGSVSLEGVQHPIESMIFYEFFDGVYPELAEGPR